MATHWGILKWSNYEELPSILRHSQNHVTDCEVVRVPTAKSIHIKFYVRQSLILVEADAILNVIESFLTKMFGFLLRYFNHLNFSLPSLSSSKVMFNVAWNGYRFEVFSPFFPVLLRKKWSFLFRNSLINMSKSVENCGKYVTEKLRFWTYLASWKRFNQIKGTKRN